MSSSYNLGFSELSDEVKEMVYWKWAESETNDPSFSESIDGEIEGFLKDNYFKDVTVHGWEEQSDKYYGYYEGFLELNKWLDQPGKGGLKAEINEHFSSIPDSVLVCVRSHPSVYVFSVDVTECTIRDFEVKDGVSSFDARACVATLRDEIVEDMDKLERSLGRIMSKLIDRLTSLEACEAATADFDSEGNERF